MNDERVLDLTGAQYLCWLLIPTSVWILRRVRRLLAEDVAGGMVPGLVRPRAAPPICPTAEPFGHGARIHPHARTHPAKPLAILAALLLTLGLAACGDDDDATSAGTGDDTTTTAPETDGGGEEVTIVAADFSLTSVTAKPGEDVYLDNTG